MEVPLLTCVAVVAHAKNLSCTGTDEIIDAFVGTPPRCTILRAVRDNNGRLLRRLVMLQRLERRDHVVTALQDAAEHGRLELLEAMYPYSPPNVPTYDTLHTNHTTAPADVMTWIRRRGKDDSLARVIAKAMKFNHVEVVTWLFARLPAWCTSLSITEGSGRFPNAIHFAARHGQLELLQLFHVHGMKGWTESVVNDAATGGHLELVKWLLANGFEEPQNAYSGAVRNGHLEVVRYGYSRGLINFAAYVRDAAESSNLELIKWFLERYYDPFRRYVLGGAVRHGYLHILHFLHGYNVEALTSNALDEAADGGHLNVIRWVYEHRAERCTTEGLANSIQSGHAGVTRFLLDHGVENCSSTDCLNSILPCAVSVAAGKGYFDMVKLLLERPRARPQETSAGIP